jgi:hypothetical protein
VRTAQIHWSTVSHGLSPKSGMNAPMGRVVAEDMRAYVHMSSIREWTHTSHA